MESKVNNKSEKSKTVKAGSAGGSLGTFGGVFTPSILTILGIILFLRLGYVTGSAGVGRALLILAVANIITILTSQSLAAIATNLKVKGGGDYYLISRTLGYKFGGTIGIVLYLAQSVSVAFYCIGFAEALSAMFPHQLVLDPRLIAVLAVSALLILAWLGADWATRFQFVVMILLVAALCSFFWGGMGKWDYVTFTANWKVPDESPPFWVIFAIFFPAVTGFTQGVSMSGDLKDPAKSLPLGTFMAVGFSILVYLAVIIVFAGVLPNKVMMEDYQAIKRVASYGFLIDAGVIAATLSSAMASFLGGPRILQSLASDQIFPFLVPFAKGSGVTANPRRAVLLTACIALITISVGQLNLIARIVSMFFLISYGLLNYATYYEADTGSPSFRPRFRWFNKYLSLSGCLICLAILLALDLRNGVLALAIMLVIYLYLKHTSQPARWADSNRSHAFQVIRQQLFATVQSPDHHRYWRPNILAFTKDPARRIPLLTFGDWLSGQSGLLTAVSILEGSEAHLRRKKKEVEEEIARDMGANNINGFSQVIRTDNGAEALPVFLQSFGIGPLRANTVLTNWYSKPGTRLPGLQALKYGHSLRMVYRQGYNLIVLHADPSKWESLLKKEGSGLRIDVWWQADSSSRLMLLFAYLMTRQKFWNKAEVRVLTAGTGERLSEASDSLSQLLDDARIPAKPHMVSEVNAEVILAESTGSSIVFLPFAIRQSRLTDMQGYSLERTLPQLPPTALVKAAEDIDLDAEPEEGAAGELAGAMDGLYSAERRVVTARKEEKRCKVKVEEIRARLEVEQESDSEKARKGEELTEVLTRAEQEAEKAFRKSAREAAKASDALQRVRELGGDVDAG